LAFIMFGLSTLTAAICQPPVAPAPAPIRPRQRRSRP
jgi:hypothetical protein